MRNLMLDIILGSTLTAGLVGAGDYLESGANSYLHPSETQAILSEILVREA